MAYHMESLETMPREQLKKLQDERLVWQVKRMYERVACFRARMDEKGLTPNDIHGTQDLHLLPFSYKKDLRDFYPYGLFAEPLKNVVRVHASSGTTGKRIVVGYTKRDLTRWADCTARVFSAAGIGENDVVQISFGYGLFTGGFGLHQAAEQVGATVVPISVGNTALQIQTMIDFGVTCLCCTPSYAMHLGEEINATGVKNQISLKAVILGAEPWTEAMREQIETMLGVKAFDIYGLSEVMGPGVAYECEQHKGMHICEDEFLAEIIDPDTEEILPYGTPGELVFTSLTKEAFPVIRYRTRDICTLYAEPCACGRTSLRMAKPAGRTDDMLIIRGVNVFPSQIEEVLLKASSGITPNYQIIVDRVNNADTFDLNVEMSDALFTDDIKSIALTERSITDELRSVLGIGVKVHLVNPKSIKRFEGKARRVIDNRKLI